MVTVPAVHRQQVGSFLLPTKEVWGKVMFLHVSVSGSCAPVLELEFRNCF